MYIKELILKNFAGVYAAMKTDYVRLDLSKRKNKICLIEGPNGKGKTVLLSQLNPFATIGNLDVRDSLNIIREKKEGYKKIVIVDNDNEFLIEHFYTPNKDSHTVKSYVKKNGTELNINGNVTSFKEIISQELDMELDYMKLIRLGSNVVNLNNLKSTDRKTYISKLLDEANVYLLYYKKINADVLTLKTLMNHINEKIHNLPSDDIYTIKEMLNTAKEKSEKIESELSKAKSDLSIIEYSVKQIGDIEEITERNKESKKKLDKLYKLFAKKGISDMSYEDICEEESRCLINYQQSLASLEKHKARFTVINDSLNDAMNQLRSCEVELNKIENDIDVDSLQEIISKLKDEIKAGESIFEKYGEINYTKKDIEDVILLFKEKQDILNTTYAFGKEPIKRVIDLMKNNKSVEEYVAYHLDLLDKKEDTADAKRFARKITNKYKNIIPKCENISCKMFQIWDEIESLANSSDDEILDGREFYTYMNLAYINIKNVILSIADHKDLFLRVPEYIRNMVKMDLLYDKISKTEIIYDNKKLMNELSFITDYTNLLDKKEELNKRKKELKNIQTSSSYGYLVEQRNTLNDKISSLLDTSKSLTIDIREETDELSYRKESLTNATELKDTIKNKDSIERDYKETTEKLETIANYRINRKSAIEKITEYQAMLDNANKLVKSYEISYEECKKLSKEIKKIKDKYEDFNILKESLSSKDGIPLLFIKLYLQNAKKTINDLLEQVYGGSIYISDFNIGPNEFNIPFMKDDIEVSDIRYASQGESSFFNIALSFAISYQSMSRYNIMLLDELDSVLDESKRQKFIAIVEKLMEMIDAEQTFVISHNNMFSMYPVDLISVVDKDTGYGKLTNYIPLEKEEKND